MWLLFTWFLACIQEMIRKQINKSHFREDKIWWVSDTEHSPDNFSCFFKSSGAIDDSLLFCSIVLKHRIIAGARSWRGRNRGHNWKDLPRTRQKPHSQELHERKQDLVETVISWSAACWVAGTGRGDILFEGPGFSVRLHGPSLEDSGQGLQ